MRQRSRSALFARIVVSLLALLLIVMLIRAVALHRLAVEGWDDFTPLPQGQSQTDVLYSQHFLGAAPDEERYRRLFEYFSRGAVERLDGSRIHYAGYGSIRGHSVTGLEGFARTAPLVAAWVSSGREQIVERRPGEPPIDLVAFLKGAILAGTDPSGEEYWGDLSANDQRIVETADIARTLWLTREQIWEKLSRVEQRRILDWLKQVDTAPVLRTNNWLLFPVVVRAFLKSVGERHLPDYSGYWRFKEGSYRESGWFTDGPGKPVDFYNAWGISYDLFWIHQMDPELDANFIRQALLQSGEITAHLVSPRGIPIMGRSPCYRTAVPSPIIVASLMNPQTVAPGLARRALDATWRYFVNRGALQGGALTMGYFGNDPRIIDPYSGPGSCHWGLRSLTLAFMAGPDHPFWTSPLQPLPVERRNYQLTYQRLGWTITGDKQSLDIVVRPGNGVAKKPRLVPHTLRHRLIEEFVERPCRPRNLHAKYELPEYSARRPLGGLLEQSGPEGGSWRDNLSPPWGCGFNIAAGLGGAD